MSWGNNATSAVNLAAIASSPSASRDLMDVTLNRQVELVSSAACGDEVDEVSAALADA